MGNMLSHKELFVWQKSMDLVIKIYNLTKTFPEEERYGLSSQMRRAVVAIPTNIAEGYQRRYIKEYIQFLYIAKGSASELETQLIIAERLDFASLSSIEIKELLLEILRMLSTLIKKLRSKSQTLTP